MKIGFTVNVKGLKRKLDKAAQIKAEEFNSELVDWVRRSLNDAVKLTPAREYSLIRKNQSREYDKRVNCIPDSHSLPDPSLRIRGRQHWLFFSGKWWNASDWKLPADAWTAYHSLLAEHERRLEYSKSAFIRDRAQARFLYKKTWVEVGQSIGVKVNAGEKIQSATTRRKPKQNPPRGYGRTQGVKLKHTIVIMNPLLKIPSKYIKFDAGEIMRTASEKHAERFQKNVRKRTRQLTSKI